MTLSKSRFKELEKRWERNRREHAGASVSIVAVPADMTDMAGLYRPQRARRGSRSRRGRTRLRGAAFVQKLAELALEWHDQRFAQCVRALLELGIVDKQSHEFSKKRGPHAISPRDSAMAYAVDKVQALRDRDPDLSENEACAVVAADWVPDAASFTAAWQRVKASRRKAMTKQARG